MSFKSGFIAMAGRPNVGKSTLLNQLCGEKIAITSPKPQTTRNRIQAIRTTEEYQMIFTDTPGLHNPKTKLGEFMMNCASNTFSESDLVLMIIEAGDVKALQSNLKAFETVEKSQVAMVLVINKIDIMPKENILKVIEIYKDSGPFKDIIPVSAKTGEGIESLIEVISESLPEGPLYYPEDTLTDVTEREIVSEIIREKILLLTNEEIPHGTGVEVMSFKLAKSGTTHIEATVYCEKRSHKGILIGKNGSMLKKIGSAARVDIENLLQGKVNLKLWVSIKEDWRNKDSMLKTLGYKNQ